MNTEKIRKIGLVFIAAAAAVGGYVAYVSWQHPSTAQTDLVLYGNIDIREADLAFNVTGRVKQMLVEEGDTVKKGMLLATLEDDIYKAEVDAAKGRVGAQSAVLAALEAGTRPEQVRIARANVRAVEAELANARIDLKRTAKLVTNDFASQQKLDNERATVKNLEARLKAAQQALTLAIRGPREEDITAARAQLNASKADLALAQQRLRYTKLFSKDRGTVQTRIVEPGAVVLPNTPVYTIALSDPVWVRTYVSERNLGKIHPGMSAKVVTDSAPDKAYEGKIGFISPVAEFTPKTVETTEVRTSLVYRLRIYVNNPDNGLRQGMPVTVRLATGSIAGAAEKPETQ